MIPFSLIKQFASEDETRRYIMAPALIGDLLVATNGRVLVEVPLCEMVLEEAERGMLLATDPRTFPDYKPIIEDGFSGRFIEVRFAVEGKSEDHIVTTTCEACAGTGEWSEPGDCELCDGEGIWQHCDWCLPYPGDAWVGGLYAEMIARLPNVRWGASAGPELIIPFTFGADGRGVLMPMRPPSYAVK